MIKVTFTDGSSKNYRIGCKKLGALSWHHLDYRPCFERIATIINIDVNKIEAWRVIQ
jgi:hypothetical protein